MEIQNNNKEINDFQFVYFIISHLKSKKIEIVLNEEKDIINSLEKVKTRELKSLKNIIYEIEIFRFKIFLNKIENEDKKNKITVILKDNNNKFESNINMQDIEIGRDCFIFNFQFEPIKKFLNIGVILPPLSLILTDCEKFELYVDLLRNDYKKLQQDKESEDLIYYTRKVFKEKKENYILYFYAFILAECYLNKNLCLKHLLSFKKDIFNINENFDKNSIRESVYRIINSFDKDINLIFKYAEGKNEEKIKLNTVNFLFYFNYFYQKKEINNIIDNNLITKYIFNILLSNEKQFEDLKLNKKSINILVKLAKNLDQINNIFIYNNDFLDILDVINENNDFIFDLYNKLDIKVKIKKIIKLKQFVKPKKDDNIEEIINRIYYLLKYEKERKIFIIKFSFEIFNKYVDIYSDNNLNNLILVYKISKYINKNDELSDIKNVNKILNILHTKGLYFLEQHKLDNNEILNYIEHDDYFVINSATKLLFNIFNNFDFSYLNSNFIKKWKKIKWEKRYKNFKLQFYQKVISLINDMKSFGYLFELFDINKEDKDYENDCLSIMENKYKILYLSDKFEKDDQFINQTVDLIYFCEIKNLDVIPLINECLYKDKSDNLDIIDNIFKKLIDKKDDYSDNLTEILFDFFNENINKGNCSSLIFLLKNKKQDKCFNSDFSIFIDKFILTKDDFFILEETDNFKIYKTLFNNNYLEEGKICDSYYTSYLSILFRITTDLDNLDIEYNYINEFYSEQNNVKNILYERLLLISNKDEKIANKYLENIDKCIDDINNLFKNFEIILKYLKFFFSESQKKNIEKIEEIIQNINTKNINYYKTIYQYFLDMKNEFLEEAEKYSELENNQLITNIYNNLKKSDNNEEKNYTEIKEFIDILKIVLEENTTKSKKINYLKLEKYFSLINNPHNNLSEELTFFINIFNIKNNIDIEKIIEEIFYLHKKTELINFVEILITFIELLEVEKTYYYSSLKIIYNNLTKSKDLSVIKLSKKILEKYGFEIDVKKNKFVDFLMKLKEKKEEREFLFENKNNSELISNKIKSINAETNNLFLGFEKVFFLINKYSNNKYQVDREIINELKNDFNNNETFSNFDNFFNKFKLFKDKL